MSTEVSRRTANRLAAIGAIIVAVLVVLVLSLLLEGSSPSGHVLYAGFTDVNQMTPGQQLRIAGRPVGEIGSIKLNKQTGMAVVALDITDNDVWPLPKGSYAIARWGSNTAYLGRYTEIIPGPSKNPPLPDGGILTPQQDQSAFELDQAYDIFRGKTAGQTQQLLTRLGATLSNEGGALKQGVAAAPQGLDQAANLLDSLSENQYDLTTLLRSGDSTLIALDDSPLQSLVSTAAGTFTTFAQHTADEQQALTKASPALTSADTTFVRLDGSLGKLTTLVNDVRPGAPQLARLARQASSTLKTLDVVAPEATATLKTGVTAAPELSQLFTAGESEFPSLATALNTTAPMLACIRPYSPEIAGFLTTWSGFPSHYDAGGHYARTFELTAIPALLPGTSNDPAKAISQSPGITYAMPRPPGLNEGHPYYLPQCGVTPSALVAPNTPEVG